jgi:hypothetical protein
MVGSLRRILSIANLIWVLLLAPIAAISLIEDYSDWRSVVGAPIARWRDQLTESTAKLPFLSMIPEQAVAALYVLLLAATVVGLYTVTIELEARRQKVLAMSIDFGSVEAAPYKGSPGESLMEGAAGAGLAGILGLSGPVGWAVALGTMGTMMAVRWAVTKGEAESHAAQQTAEINRRRERHINDAVARFVRTERRRLLVGAAIALAIVVVSFWFGRT